MPSDRATVLGAWRYPPVATPTRMGKGAKSVGLFTSKGLVSMSLPQYAAAVEALRPDVAIAPADAPPPSSARPSSKRLARAVQRSEDWLDQLVDHFGGGPRLDELRISLFAPVLAVEQSMQQSYLRRLAEEVTSSLSGLAVYEAGMVPGLMACYPSLAPLPRLSLECASTPHEALRQVSLGVDLLAPTFVNRASESGVALSFAFAAPAGGRHGPPLPLGLDMLSAEHATSLEPLSDGCACQACACHHRAYLHHLLNAKEMLGLSLLQIHNHHVACEFLADVRRALARGVAEFDEGRRRFSAAYQPELPEGAGESLRPRGRRFESEAGQAKGNTRS